MISIERVAMNTIEFNDLRYITRTQFEDQALHQCLLSSLHVYQGKIDGAIACVWGLVPPTVMSNRAYIWLYTTDVADEHTFILARYSQLLIRRLLEEYEALTGHCRIGDERAIKWMKWLGAEFGDYQGNLISFVIRRKDG